MSELLSHASKAIAAGFPVVFCDKSKRPLGKYKQTFLSAWESGTRGGKYLDFLVEESLWAQDRWAMIGIIMPLDCEVLDIDTKNCNNDTEEKELIYKVREIILSLGIDTYEVETPSGGQHYYFRIENGRGKRGVLARGLPDTEAGAPSVLAELRGPGNYVCFGPGYKVLTGDISGIATISKKQQRDIHTLISELTDPRLKTKVRTSDEGHKKKGSSFPGFNEEKQNEVAKWLEEAGWKKGGGDAIGHKYGRPGKLAGETSAVLFRDSGGFYVFSTSTIFPPNTYLTPFSVYTYLFHAGDFDAAAQHIEELGYEKEQALIVPREQQNLIDSWGLWYDEVQRKTRFTATGRRFADTDFSTLYLQGQSEIGSKWTQQRVQSLITSSRVIPFRNPIKEYYNSISSLSYSTELTDLIEHFDYAEETTSILKRIMRKWFLQLAATMHGYSSELFLVLIGKKGNEGKTEFFKRLLPTPLREYLAKSDLPPTKDFDILTTEKILIFDDEFESKRRADEINRVKSLLSTTHFDLRRPYGRETERVKRLAVFAGTSNTAGIITDITANRRFVPVEITGRDFDFFDHLDKDVLFSNIYNEFLQKGEASIRLTESELEYLRNYSHDYRVESRLEALILEYFSPAEATEQGAVHLSSTEIIDILAIFSQTSISTDVRWFGRTINGLQTPEGQFNSTHTGKKRGYWVRKKYTREDWEEALKRKGRFLHVDSAEDDYESPF